MIAPLLAPAAHNAKLDRPEPGHSPDSPAAQRQSGRAPGVRWVPAPPLAPPYDDERWPQGIGSEEHAGGSVLEAPRLGPGQPGGLALSLPFPAPSPAVPRLRLASPAESPAPQATVPPPALWAARFVRVLLEVMAGLRPVSQLGAWADSEVCRRIARRIGTADRCQDLRRSVGTLRSLHVSSPAPGVAEVCAVVEFGDRVRAVALRAEAAGTPWRCTGLIIG